MALCTVKLFISYKIKCNKYFYSRAITLPGSAFDGKKQLLAAVRKTFPDGTINIACTVQNANIAEYWQYLLGDYRKSDICGSRIGYEATHLGIQEIPSSSNYWFMGDLVISVNNLVK